MELKILQDIENRGPLPQISFKPDPSIGKKPNKKGDSLKVDKKTHPGETDSETVSIYVLILNTGLAESLLKFLLFLKKHSMENNPQTGPQRNATTKPLLYREALIIS